MQRVPMTKHGFEKATAELLELKSVTRPRIIAAIADARAHGDLKENAEYHAAREQQSFAEGRIAELESKLSNAQVIDVTQMPKTGKVIFGSTVTLMDLETEAEVKYHIVGDDEADIKLSKISVGSPIARALIGKEEGQEVIVKTPKGESEYEIVAVEYI
ncbi:MAG: transcription elongation factor GreA [Gammaproteobacteria bacterium]|nr:transcription elongation factor GreA [Gammaproteobacteria bacterium]